MTGLRKGNLHNTSRKPHKEIRYTSAANSCPVTFRDILLVFYEGKERWEVNDSWINPLSTCSALLLQGLFFARAWAVSLKL
jgi:hypothetical protein